MALNFIPVGKLLSEGAKVANLIRRAFPAVRAFFREAAAAKKILNEERIVAEEVAAEAKAAPVACPFNSFTGDTPVKLADGSSKPIAQVKVGDKVQNAAPDSPTVETHTVTAIHVTDTDHDFVDVTVDTLFGPKTITTTAHHLLWDTTTHTWTNAADLHPGDQLDTPGNGHATITATHPYTATLRTYNLTIDTLHTYYVLAGTTPVLVHNCGGAVFRTGRCPETQTEGRSLILTPLTLSWEGKTGETAATRRRENLTKTEILFVTSTLQTTVGRRTTTIHISTITCRIRLEGRRGGARPNR